MSNRATFLVGILMMGSIPAWGESASENPLARLLESGEAIFGVFSGEKTAENARKLAKNDQIDFVFYDMEQGPFDVPGMKTYMKSLGERAIAARLPPIREGFDEARERAKELGAAGVQGVFFPHVENREQAELAASAMADTAALGFLIIEDRVGVENAREIVSTPGIDVVIPGPGDLRRAYEGDAAAVEEAIQTVLAACRELEVPCGITAGPGDVEQRLAEGFRVIITNDHETLPVGRRAAKR